MKHTEHAITIHADLGLVWEVLADIEGYAELFAPTQSVQLLEEADGLQVARLTVEVAGQLQSWVTRRELDRERGVISYHQIDTAPIVDHMSGEWRCFALDGNRVQLVLTHDFRARSAEFAARLDEAVERNSRHDLDAVKLEAEGRAAAIRR